MKTETTYCDGCGKDIDKFRVCFDICQESQPDGMSDEVYCDFCPDCGACCN